MKKTILITGSNSGVGLELTNKLSQSANVIGLTREILDHNNVNSILAYPLPYCDILINCAAHDLGGKVDFVNHDATDLVKIINCNLISSILLTQKALQNNNSTRIVNITSTNINRYYGNDLIYTLTKKALSDFTQYLHVDYPKCQTLEVILGLTKTNFNNNRHKNNHKEIDDLYNNSHLLPGHVADKIIGVLYDNSVSKIEIKPCN